MHWIAGGLATLGVLACITLWRWFHKTHTPRRYRVWSASRNAVVWNDELDIKDQERDL